MIGDLIKASPKNGDDDGDDPPIRIYRRRRWFSAFLWRLAVLLFIVALIGAFIIYLKIRPLHQVAQDFDMDLIDDVERASIIYDRANNEVGRIFVENRRPVPLSDVPRHLVEALVAAEDSRYFKHEGVDYTGTVRAILRTVRAKIQGRSSMQGGSTITQQLARNSFGLSGRTVNRKITEIFLARRIERRFSKEEILELYLNRIYFGSGKYGVDAASYGYFGKPVSELDLGECATLCGLIKSPNRLSPIKNPEGAKRERDYVLDRMTIEGLLEEGERDRWKATEIITSPVESIAGASYVYEEIRQRVIEHLGFERAAGGGFQIHTTIDLGIQQVAEESLHKRLGEVEGASTYEEPTYADYQATIEDYEAKLKAEEIDPKTPRPAPDYLQGAVLLLENKSGAVIAMVGGRDFRDTQYNRAIQGSRPVGPTIKPFVYGAAFADGETYPGTLVSDTHIDNRRVMIGGFTGILGEWGSESHENSYLGDITARQSLVLSKNAASVRVGEKVGTEVVKEVASRAGIRRTAKSGKEDKRWDYPASFLGSGEANLAQMAMAYTTFPRGGTRADEIFFIRRIVGDNEVVEYEHKTEGEGTEVFDPVTSYLVHSCLADVTKDGTASHAKAYGLADFPHGAKTGTHYNFTDLWFLGYSSEVTCGVWSGFDKPKTIYRGAFSNAITLPVWSDIMNEVNKTFTPQEFEVPPGIDEVEICRSSGRRATDACYDSVDLGDGRKQFVRTTYMEVAPKGFSFSDFCQIHQGDEGAPSGILAAPSKERAELAGDRLGNGNRGSIAGAESVRMRAPTVIGDDPYQSVRPILKAMVVEEEGNAGAAPKAKVVAPPMGDPKNRIQLKPPKPLEIE